MSIGNSPESLSRAMLVETMLAGILGVHAHVASCRSASIPETPVPPAAPKQALIYVRAIHIILAVLLCVYVCVYIYIYV